MSVAAPPPPGLADDHFEEIVAAAQRIRAEYIDPRVTWYRTHTNRPRFLFRVAGVLTILLSVTLPALVVAPAFHYKQLVLSVASIAIAPLAGLGSFYRWERTWRGKSTAQLALEQHIAKWELELTNARMLLDPAARAQHVYQATDDLLTNARNVVSAESEGFFAALQFKQQNTPPKG
jgi:hypothetical protein